MVTAVVLAHLLFMCAWKLFNTSSHNISLTLQKELKEPQVTQHASFTGWGRLAIDCFQLQVTSSNLLLFTESNQYTENQSLPSLCSHPAVAGGHLLGRSQKVGWQEGKQQQHCQQTKGGLGNSPLWPGSWNQHWHWTILVLWILLYLWIQFTFQFSRNRLKLGLKPVFWGHCDPS